MQDLVKKNILIVDDTEANIDVLVETLGDEYDVSVAMDGESALEEVNANPPDLILLDIMMPGIDGYEVCRRLKADAKNKEILVIFITALGQVEDETRGLKLGAVDYITKPISPPIVKARLENHLELKQARDDLKKQNEILQENARLRDDMERISRHDLKTPLNSIISMPQILMQDRSLGKDHVEMLKAIEKSGYTILNMINLSLDLFKMEKGTYQLQPCGIDLLSIIHKIIFDLKSFSDAKGIKFNVSINEEKFGILGEELLCYSMFANLIKNAVEASPNNGILSVILSKEGIDEAKICIHNYGVVPESIRDNFFGKYSTSGKKSGTGLGTYSAKLMAETLGGKISMSTSETDGTAITVKLKQAKVIETFINQNAKTDMEQLPFLKILIVDDDEYNRIILARYLNYRKLDIEFADNGQSAVDKFIEKKFDIIFLDMEMPVMNGIDAACLIRKLESKKSVNEKPTILVALSGHDDEKIRQACLNSGFNYYLSKPVSNTKLRETLLKFFKNKSDILEVEVEVDSDLQDLIPSFLSDKKKELETIFEMLNSNEYESVQKAGHRLKGGFNMYGFKRLGTISSVIEEAAKQKDYDTIKNNIELLTACLKNIRVKYINMD